MTFKMMTSQVVQRARPLSGRIWLLARQRVKLTIRRGQSTFNIVHIFVSYEEKAHCPYHLNRKNSSALTAASEKYSADMRKA